MRGKEKDLLIEKLEKNHGINRSEVYKVAKCYYAKTQYQEVLTKKKSPITYIEETHSSPCLQLLPVNLHEGILAITKNELLIFDITDKKYQYPLYQLTYNNINSIAQINILDLFFEDDIEIEIEQIQIILDDKNAIILDRWPNVSGLGGSYDAHYILQRLFYIMKKKGVKEFNKCPATPRG